MPDEAAETFRVETAGPEKRLYVPIDSFGTIYLQANPWHTNAVGYEFIAEAILQERKKNSSVRKYVRRAAAD